LCVFQVVGVAKREAGDELRAGGNALSYIIPEAKMHALLCTIYYQLQYMDSSKCAVSTESKYNYFVAHQWHQSSAMLLPVEAYLP